VADLEVELALQVVAQAALVILGQAHSRPMEVQAPLDTRAMEGMELHIQLVLVADQMEPVAAAAAGEDHLDLAQAAAAVLESMVKEQMVY
jgi:hypothetical protein